MQSIVGYNVFPNNIICYKHLLDLEMTYFCFEWDVTHYTFTHSDK